MAPSKSGPGYILKMVLNSLNTDLKKLLNKMQLGKGDCWLLGAACVFFPQVRPGIQALGETT